MQSIDVDGGYSLIGLFTNHFLPSILAPAITNGVNSLGRL